MEKREQRQEIKLNAAQSRLLIVSVVVIILLGFSLGYILGGSGGESTNHTPLPARVPFPGLRAPEVRPDEDEQSNLIKESELTFYDTLTSERKDVKKEGTSERKRGGRDKAGKRESGGEVETAKKDAAPGPEPILATLIESPDVSPVQKEGKYALQVASFKYGKDAERLKQRLDKKGYNSYTLESDIKGITWHRVRLGGIRTKADAEALAKKLLKQEKLKSFIFMQ